MKMELKVPFPGLSADGLPVPLVTFLGVLVAYPEARLGVIVRNFNTIEPVRGRAVPRRMSVALDASFPDRDDDLKADIWTVEVNLSRVFPAEIMEKLRARTPEDLGTVTVSDFLEVGQDLATAMKRVVTIIHKQGGDPPEYSDLATFYPK